MVATSAERFVVSTADDLDELELALTEGGLASVIVDIPESSSALLGAREFRRIVAAARNVGTRIEFQTDDVLRRELARIVGARLVEADPSQAARAETEATPDAALTHRIEAAIAPPATTRNDDDTFRLWQPGQQAGHWDEPEHTDASYSFVITPPMYGNVVVEDLPTQTHTHWDERIPRFEDWERIAPLPSRMARPSKSQRSHVIAALLVATSLLALAGLLAAFVVPTAAITVMPLTSPIGVDLTYGIAQPGATWDIVIQPTLVETTLTFSATSPTTGERFEPDAAAVGVLQLTNAATEELVIPAGTSFFSDTGGAVISVTEIVVPPADPYSSLTFGSALVDVRAVDPGPDGNIDSQSVFGQLDNGVFFVNREPMTGGTTRRIATVTQADLDALSQQARADLASRFAGALDGKIAPGQQLVPASQQTHPVTIAFDTAVGSDAVSVKIDASQRVSAHYYDPSVALQQARDEAARRITAAPGPNARLVSGSVAIGEPQSIDGGNGTAFALHASGSAETIIDADALEAIRSELAGSSQDAATARIRQLPGVASVTIVRQRAWLGDGLPRFASRISVVVLDASGTEKSAAHAEGLSTETAPSGTAPAGP